MSSSSIHLNKLLQRTTRSSQQTEDVKQFIYTRSKWSDKEVNFTFIVSAENKCYKSSLTEEEFKCQAAELDKNYAEFYEDCKKALTANISLPGYDYEIDADELQFKLIRCQGFETVYLELKLREVSNNTSTDMLDTAIELLNEQTEQKSATVVDQKIMQEYENYVKEAKDLERTMLKKFILLLNSKKEKIRDLQEEVKRLHRRQRRESTDEEMAQDTEVESDVETPNASNNETGYDGVTQAMTPPSTAKSSVRKRSHTDQHQTDSDE